MKQYIKPTAVILGAQLLFGAGIICRPTIENYFNHTKPQEMAKITNYVPKEYSMNERQTAHGYDTRAFANLANGQSYIDIPDKPKGGK